MSVSLQRTHGRQGTPEAVRQARELVRENLRRTACDFTARGLPEPALDGKLLRPLTSYLIVPEERRGELDHRFWAGALAIEMVHEASLLHDDILDQAPERRGRPTMAARAGVGPALVLGDHLLTAAYRAAAETGSPIFLQAFIRGVERTVAGEIAQEKCQGEVLGEEEYARIVTGKSGELFRVAFSLAPILLDIGNPQESGKLGARLGLLYQMVDDILDYCTHAERGKVPLQDLRQAKWTWPLGLIPEEAEDGGGEGTGGTLHRLFGQNPSTGLVPMAQGARRIREDAHALTCQIRDHGLESTALSHVLNGWVELVEESVGQELNLRNQDRDGGADKVRERTSVGGSGNPDSRPEAEAVRALLQNRAASIATPESRLRYFGHHSKSFRFAARWFSRRRLQEVADVYAFCRFTDDLVDEEGDTATPQQRSARLAEWGRMAEEAYEGIPTGTPGLDQVMETMRDRKIPFTYARELIRGVEMDLNPAPFPTLQSLRVYSYRVASVVGEWITQLFGIDDPWMLERARALGHAMQLTNILRDVGEDLRQGRLYLPEDRMEAHGVDRRVLQAKMGAGTPALPGYRNLVEELMADAEANYERAFEAIPRLPRPLRTAVAVAASVYQGIHEEIRKNRYDNLTRRAHTSFFRKVVLASRGLWRLRGKVEHEHRSRAGAWRTVLALLPAMLWGPPALAQGPGTVTMAQDEGVPSIPTQWASTYLENLGNPSPGNWTESGLRLERIRALYHLAVEERDDTEAFADFLKLALGLAQDGSPLEVTLAGYRGALQIVRAKHARWPPNKLKHLDRGAATLDSLVTTHPDHLEVRYLRFASYRFLPFFLKRDDAVADDEEVLAQSLVNRPQAFSDPFYRVVVGFVLAYGSLDQEQQARLAQVVSRRP